MGEQLPLRTRIPGRRAAKRAFTRLGLWPEEERLACRAPFTSLHVDQFGDVRPCCQSTRLLGRVSEQTLGEIWHGEPLAELRRAIEADDLSLGCEHCAWGGRRSRADTYATRFDRDRMADDLRGPTRLELAPSNACNLQCSMCNGDWSSSIRLHREGRPALPRTFAERQLDEVAALAPDLDEVHLFGGEPLLMPEALRLLEIGAETDTRCVITTNGSVLTSRVEALLDRPGVDLVVSVDGASAAVYEPIRRGASWAALEEHLDRFVAIAARHGNKVDLAHCLMVQNWYEFPEFLAWAEARGLEAYVNDVVHPTDASLHLLTPPELDVVVRSLRSRQAEVRRLGPAWRSTWTSALARLEQSVADGEAGDHHARIGPLAPRADDDGFAAAAAVAVELSPHLRASGFQVGAGELPAVVDLGEALGRASGELRTLVAPGTHLETCTTLEWSREVSIEQRRYRVADGWLVERRTARSARRAVALRFEFEQDPPQR